MLVFLFNFLLRWTTLRKPLANLLFGLLLLVGLWGFVHLLFYTFPLAYRMASNADSLVMLDFARDLLLGHSIAQWNLPRVPYLFPDTVIALAVMAFGWFSPTSFYVIALINYLIVIGIGTIALRQARGLEHLPFWQAAFAFSLSLLSIGIILPSAFTTLYWQVFASGAHFLSAAVVLGMMQLSRYWQAKPTQYRWIAILFILAIAEGVSNSMAALLLLIWCGTQWLDRLLIRSPMRADVLVVFGGVLIGSLLSTLIPRQSLADSFFSLDKFIAATHAFGLWFVSDAAHWGLIGILLTLLIAYPLLLIHQSESARKPVYFVIFHWLWRSPVLWPSLGVMAATPLFFQEAGSIRYLAFPALIALLSLSLMYVRLWQIVGRYQWMFLAVGAIMLSSLAWWQWQHTRIGPVLPPLSGKDLGGLATGAQTDLAMACLTQAKAQRPLEDGLATYWNARPTRFASQFAYYFAQINPWRPRSGYMVWGNNAMDFVYRDFNAKTPRSYNFVLATQDELASRLWGSLPSQASFIVTCPAHRILYFEDPSVLWNFLFPLEVPFGFDRGQSTSESSSTARHARERIFPADDFFTVVGERHGTTITAVGKAGVLAYGPYIPLPPGEYRLIARGQLQQARSENALIDVSTQFGKKLIANKVFTLPAQGQSIPSKSGLPALPTNQAVITQMDFTLPTTTDDVEFRLQVPKDTYGVFIQFELQRLQ